MYEIKDPLWQFVDHWQTLIAGLLAVAAGAGTIGSPSNQRRVRLQPRKTKPTPHSSRPQSCAKWSAGALPGKGTPFT
jgi:hypothetical protein